jgi:KaiC/GvpD/RAD55 family RecA-like ATPase
MVLVRAEERLTHPEVHVPIFSDLVPGGFSCGANYLVEFEPDSLWYEASLTIAAQALRSGVRTQYHTFMHIPQEVRQGLQNLGSDLKKLESEDKFRLIDSYTSLTGLPIQPEPADLTGRHRLSINDPSYLEHYTENIVTILEKGAPETDKRWLHIDDNTSIFNRYFKEQDVLNIFHTRVFQLTRILELSAFHSVVAGVWSESFYKQFETQCDGVIDFKTEEDEGQLENFVRVRSIRGKSCDSRWRHLRLEGNGEVMLDKLGEAKKKEIGISGWLKGPKKK